ncbi:MAG: hypothetical protein LBU97_00620 [Alistipes sp.]|jgi:hypothetical protein|nr:hypothetical protein [Alistipes sp.]
MRKLFFFAVATIAIVTACGGDPGEPEPPEWPEMPQEQAGEGYYYYYSGEKEQFELDTRYAYLALREPIMPEDIVERGVEYDEFRLTDIAEDFQQYTKLILEDGLSDRAYLAMLSDIKNANPEIVIQPYLKTKDGVSVGMSNLFYVKLKRGDDTELLEWAAGQFDCVVDHQNEFMPLWYTLALTENSKRTTIECSAIFHESGLFSAAEPDLFDN